MPKLLRWLPLLAVAALLAPATASADLFFSEYIEGSSFNKYVEIYNSTGAAVDLSDYRLDLYSNGSASITTSQVLSGILADGDVFVVGNTSVAGPVPDLLSGAVNYNGDDAFALFKISAAANLDVIGQIGFDPGTEWNVGGVSTLNMTLRRKPDVCAGDPDGSNVFDPSVEWDAFAIDTFDGLGSHTSSCGPVPVNSSTWGRVKSLYR